MAAGDVVEIDGHRLPLSNLGKVLYPACGFTKGQVVDYYVKVSEAMLPHLRARAATRKRWPDGVESQPFFEKNAPRGTPEWVRTVSLPSPGSTKDRERISYVVVEDLATLVWCANLAALELHVPQWRLGPRGAPRDPDLLVADLDPGAPAGMPECMEIALALRERFAADGLTAYAKTSGSKGLQVYAPISGGQSAEIVSAYAKSVAEEFEAANPLVVSRMARALRPGKVLIDWSQNNAAKTTVAPYSLRGRERPTVSTPLTWAEVEAGRPVSFEAPDVVDRVHELGDLMKALVGEAGPRLPA